MPSKSVEELDKEGREALNLYNYRIEAFTELLGQDWAMDDIFTLANSDVDYHDLRKLLKKGCTKELALKILL